MALKLGQKLLICITLLVTGLVMAIMATIHFSITNAVRDEIQNDLSGVQKVFEEFQRLRSQELLANARTVAEIPQLKAVVTTPDIDHATLLDTAREVQKLTKSDLFMLCDARGELLVSVTEPDKYQEDVTGDPAFAAALQRKFYQGVRVVGNQIYQVVAGPFLLENDVVGALLVGFSINSIRVQSLEQMLSCQLAVVGPGAMVTSQSSAAFFEKLEQMKLLSKKGQVGSGIHTQMVEGERYIFFWAPFGQDEFVEIYYAMARSLDKELAAFRNLRRKLIFLTIIILCVALGIGWFFSRGITQSIQVLVEGTRKISGGDLQTRIKVSSKDEIGDLGVAFNRMVEDLQKTTVSRDALAKEITERKRYEQIAIQSEKMAMAGELAFGVAHEVKNPLAILLQGIDYLTSYAKSDDKNVPGLLEDMTRAVKRADYVVRGLLDLGRSTRFEFKPEDLNPIIDSVLLLLKRHLETGRIRIIKNFADNFPKISVDRGKMMSVFVNLLSNAADAMPPGGSITITAALQDLTEVGSHVGRRKEDTFKVGQEVAVIKIEDTGSGIPEDALPHIFDPFFTTRRGRGGTGLGLSVAKNIVEMHHGTIELTNREEGGARATIMLPMG
ncbi:MAG: HAMP domain-containing protein [Candidatus Omnitrophica bacterium]|nr:HAMP domain-containing protein [Candidatus Omnitrophota bacterium]